MAAASTHSFFTVLDQGPELILKAWLRNKQPMLMLATVSRCQILCELRNWFVSKHRSYWVTLAPWSSQKDRTFRSFVHLGRLHKQRQPGILFLRSLWSFGRWPGDSLHSLGFSRSGRVSLGWTSFPPSVERIEVRNSSAQITRVVLLYISTYLINLFTGPWSCGVRVGWMVIFYIYLLYCDIPLVLPFVLPNMFFLAAFPMIKMVDLSPLRGRVIRSTSFLISRCSTLFASNRSRRILIRPV